MSTIRPRLAHYELTRKVGSGRFGDVYIAWDAKRGREVALKVLPAWVMEIPEKLARFEREAKLLASLNHPHIASPHSIERAEGTHFLTMELVKGRRLSEEIGPGGLPLHRLLPWAIPLADALATAHQQGILHRNLRSANVLVRRDGRVVVLDFGLGLLRRDAPKMGQAWQASPDATKVHTVVDSLTYSSPEQVAGSEMDARSEVFSLGVILYEMATGRKPFAKDTPTSALHSILHDPPEPLTGINPTLPVELQGIVCRCLEKDPKRRFQAALELRNELEALKNDRGEGDQRESGPPADEFPPAKGRWVRGWWGR